MIHFLIHRTLIARQNGRAGLPSRGSRSALRNLIAHEFGQQPEQEA
jgi:hypothetical protein